MGIRKALRGATILSEGSADKKRDRMRLRSTILKSSKKKPDVINTSESTQIMDDEPKCPLPQDENNCINRTDTNIIKQGSMRFRRRRKSINTQKKRLNILDTKKKNSPETPIGPLNSENEISSPAVDYTEITESHSHFQYPILFLTAFVAFVSIVITLYTPSFSDRLGDEIRSEESSHHFFQSVDRDGDGILKAQEVAFFLEDSIGGSSFDTTSEVNDEVHKVMQDLDRDKDEGLEEGDVVAYWEHLESLLTAEEVKEWIENAVQLPESVGNVFKDNRITVYDFPELVENKGASIRDDLGITEKIFYKKILRHIRARLLGVGTVPDALDVSKIKYNLESCSTVSFSWLKPDARGFPVHSYRVQRRDVELHSNADKSISNYFYGPNSPPSSVSQWITVYSGGEPTFHDNTLQLGHDYKYRIQAWNSVGRSPWVDINITKLLKQKKCTKIMNLDERSVPDESSGPLIIVEFIVKIVSIISTLVYVAATVMRLRRASAPSTLTATKYATPIPWLIHSINKVSNKIVGMDLLPIPTQVKSESHDESIKAIGLNGYKKSNSLSELSETDNPSRRRRKMKKASSERSMQTLSSNEENPKPRRQKSSSSFETCVDEDMKEETSNVRFPMRKMHSLRRKSLGGSLDTIKSENEDYSINRVEGVRNVSLNTLDSIDNDKVCNTCLKPYKFGKRYKHHCARCLATFCHKHGRTTHSNFTSCKVPGDCVCNICLALERQG